MSKIVSASLIKDMKKIQTTMDVPLEWYWNTTNGNQALLQLWIPLCCPFSRTNGTPSALSLLATSLRAS